MNKPGILAGVALVAGMNSGLALAGTVKFDAIVASWINPQPSDLTTLSYANNGTPNPRVRWGSPATSSGQSGYDFDAASPLPIAITLPPSPSSDFVLGTFRHQNWPVYPPSLTGIDLAVSAEVLIDDISQGTKTFLFDVLHDETTNTGDCPFGGANNQGVNRNGCADRVRFVNGGQTAEFVVDGLTYTLDITGFLVAGVATTEFLTTEERTNTAQLTARLLLTSEPPVPPVPPVPVPPTLLLFGAGLLALGLRRRRHP